MTPVQTAKCVPAGPAWRVLSPPPPTPWYVSFLLHSEYPESCPRRVGSRALVGHAHSAVKGFNHAPDSAGVAGKPPRLNHCRPSVSGHRLKLPSEVAHSHFRKAIAKLQLRSLPPHSFSRSVAQRSASAGWRTPVTFWITGALKQGQAAALPRRGLPAARGSNECRNLLRRRMRQPDARWRNDGQRRCRMDKAVRFTRAATWRQPCGKRPLRWAQWPSRRAWTSSANKAPPASPSPPAVAEVMRRPMTRRSDSSCSRHSNRCASTWSNLRNRQPTGTGATARPQRAKGGAEVA